jgi:hypothetical protein
MDDLFYIVSTVFVLAVTIVIGTMFLDIASPYLTSLSVNNSADYNVTSVTISRASDTFTETYDSGFAVLFVLMIAASMILGSLLPTNPLFFIPFIFVMALLVTVTSITSNLWESFITDPLTASTASKFTFIPFIMSNLPFLVTGLGFALAIIVYVSYKRN